MASAVRLVGHRQMSMMNKHTEVLTTRHRIILVCCMLHTTSNVTSTMHLIKISSLAIV